MPEQLEQRPTEQKKKSSSARSKTVTMTDEQLQNLIAASNKAAIEAASAMMNQGHVDPQNAKTQTNAINNSLARRMNLRQGSAAKFYQRLANESSQQVNVRIDRIYQDYIGSHLTVTLNGSVIKVPVDGQVHKVHSAYLPIIEAKKQFISNRIAQNSRNDDWLGEGDIVKIR